MRNLHEEFPNAPHHIELSIYEMPTPEQQYFDKILKSGETFFSRWRNASAELRELTTSHKSLRILLIKENRSENLMISCLDPVWIQSPTAWDSSAFTLSKTTLPDGEEGFLLAEEKSNMKILCAAIEIKENVKLQ